MSRLLHHRLATPTSRGVQRLSDWAVRVRLPLLSRLALAFAILIGMLGLAVDRVAWRESEEHLRSDLESSLASYEAVLRMWVGGLETAVAEAAREPSLVDEARDLARLHHEAAALSTAPAAIHIRERLRPVTGDIRSIEFVIIDTGGICIAASSDDHLGAALNPQIDPWLKRVESRSARMTPPLSFPIFTSTDRIGHVEPSLVTLIGAPIVDANGDPQAVLAFVVALEPTLTRLLSTWQLESQGAETYAFDRSGHLLSTSKRRAAPHEAGLEPAPRGSSGETGFELRDPGGDLLAGYRPPGPDTAWPLVHPVAMALSTGAGFDVRGYRSYLGRYRVGAWTWLDAYGFGIVTERDREAVYRHHRVPRFAISMASGIALVSAAAGLLSSWIFARLARGAALSRAVGPYELIERIGSGAMGEVYLAQHALLRRPTAIKVMRSERTGSKAARRFESEVATTASLSHPNTISIYDYGHTEDGRLYFAMEYLRGFTVGRMVDAFGPTPESRALLILTRVTSALAEAHAIGFVHGDVSSQNVMLCKLGGIADFVKLLDFGLARRADQPRAPGDEDVTGTPAFMGPEVFDHSVPVGSYSDVYAAGALGYFLITGHAPFEVANAFAIYEAHRRERVPNPSERVGRALDEGLERVLMRSLEKDPARRWSSVGEMEAALRACKSFGAWTLADAETWWQAHAAELLPQLDSFPFDESDRAAARAKTAAIAARTSA